MKPGEEDPPEFKWAQELTENEKDKLKSTTLVGYDPGKVNLMKISGRGNDGKITQFNYSMRTRNWLIYCTTSRIKIEKVKRSKKRIRHIEDYLSQFNSKSSKTI